MARLRSGILGNIRGKVAGVVGSQWKNKNYVREYVKPANPNTAAQQVQRTLMQDCVAFCKTLVGPIFNAYTDKFQKSMSGFNFFVKRNIALFSGENPENEVNLTEGKLSPLSALEMTYDTATGAIVIAFDKNLGNNGADADKVFWCAYDKSTGLWYFADGEVARSTEADTQTIVSGLTATNLRFYAFAIKYAGAIVSMISDDVDAQATAA